MAQTTAFNDAGQADDDHSLIMRPINLGSAGVQHIVRSLRDGTAEVRNLLLNECNVIYECKVCRSLHRSLANFIAHKRVYCMKHCCESMLLFDEPDIEKETVIVQPESPDSGTIQEEDYQSELAPTVVPDAAEGSNIPVEVGVSSPKMLRSLSSEAKTKDPSKVVGPVKHPPISSGEIETFYDKCAKHLENRADNQSKLMLRVKTVDSNHNAVFQVVASEDDSSSAAEQKKPQESTPTNECLEDKRPPPQVMTTEEKQKMMKKKIGDSCCCTCFKCGAKFTSVKTMTIHLRSIHAKKRVYFPCPYCKAMFSQSWGVVRHLLTIHKKTKEQVNKLRGKIRQKAWQKATNDKDSDDEVVPQTAKEASKPQASSGTTASKSLQTGSPTISLKKAVGVHKCPHCGKVFTQSNTLAKHVESCCSKEASAPFTNLEPSSSRPKRVVKKKVIQDFVNSSRLTIRASTVSKGDNVKRAPPNIEKKILILIDTKKLECVQCKRPFTTLSNLRRHAAQHVGWNRYKCKYCEYQSYSRSECRNHVKRVHITKRQLQSQADKFILDLPAEDTPQLDSPPPPSASKPPAGEEKSASTTQPGATVSSESKPVINKKTGTVVDALVSQKKPVAATPPVSRQASKRRLSSTDETKPKMVPCKKAAAATADVLDPKPANIKKPSPTASESPSVTPKKTSPDSKPAAPLQLPLPTVKRVEIPPQEPKPAQIRIKKNGGAAPSVPSSPADLVTKLSNGITAMNRKSPSTTPVPQPTSFNISTRLSPRTFDITPYRPAASQVATLVTRSSTYVKSDPAPATTKREDDGVVAPTTSTITTPSTKALRKKSPRHIEAARTTGTSSNGFYAEMSTSSSRLCDHNYSVELNRIIKPEPVSDDSC